MNFRKILSFALATFVIISLIMTSLVFCFIYLDLTTKDADLIMGVPYYLLFAIFFAVLFYILSVILFMIVCLYKDMTFYKLVSFLIVSIMFVFMCLLLM